MLTSIRTVTVDCRDPFALAQFWSGVLGFVQDPNNPSAPGDPEALIADPTGRHPGLLFVAVPESKAIKNRLHLDLQPIDTQRDATVDYVVGIGATLVDDRRHPDGTGWAVLADPEGNEFCILRSAAERGERVTTNVPERDFPELRTADERTMLLGMLDWYREGVVAKVAGLSDESAKRRLVGSDTTAIGLVKHLALVEDSWLDGRFAGNPEPSVWASAPFDADPDWEMQSALDEALTDVVALYEEACERSRRVVAAAALEDLSRNCERPFTLRYALVHLVEETARHLGHLDILRELTDGTVGE